ncbi:MAG: hypothetical protein ACYTET_01010 [Planctomycetota bacterium]|jgi:hypothetical protein
MSEKLVKILAVIFLTLLIWTWAFMELEEDFSGRGVMAADAAMDPSYLVTFPNHINSDNKVPLEVTFVGSPAKVSELREKYRAPLNDPERENLAFGYNPVEMGHTEAGNYTINVLDFLSNHNKTGDLALTLASCEPKWIEVQIELLEKKTLPIKCRDENGDPIKAATPDPARVTVYVREGYTGPAYVTLTEQQIEQARLQQVVRATPYVQFGTTSEIRQADESVSITLTEQLLDSMPFKPQRIGFVISPELQQKIKSIELDEVSESQLRETTNFRASAEAMAAYAKMPYHILIEIKDSDLTLEEIPPKKVIYNLPPEFVRTGQIEPVGNALTKTAMITITPVSTTVTP